MSARIAAASLLALFTTSSGVADESAEQTASVRSVYVATVHLDGNATTEGDAAHPAEAFPSSALPAGGGLSLTAPATDGRWRIRMFGFEPSQIVAFQGERLRLVFVGVHGPSHRIRVGDGPTLTLRRGTTVETSVATDTPGVIRFESLDRSPSMQGAIVVVPRGED